MENVLDNDWARWYQCYRGRLADAKRANNEIFP